MIMKTMTSAKAFWTVTGLSLALFLVTCWSAYNGDTTPYWVESLGYFILTYYCLEFIRAKNQSVSIFCVTAAAVLGRIIIDVPLRVMDCFGTLWSLLVVISCIVAILLAACCYNSKKPVVFILSYIIMALFNSVVAINWAEFVHSRF